MSQTCRAATLVAPARIEVREYPVPDIPPDGGLLKVEMGGVCGTDYKYYTGKLNLPMPIILGHEILGRVEKLGARAAEIHGVEEGDPRHHQGIAGVRPLRGLPARRGPVLQAAFRLRLADVLGGPAALVRRLRRVPVHHPQRVADPDQR